MEIRCTFINAALVGVSGKNNMLKFWRRLQNWWWINVTSHDLEWKELSSLEDEYRLLEETYEQGGASIITRTELFQEHLKQSSEIAQKYRNLRQERRNKN